jgi:hypothetical protein
MGNGRADHLFPSLQTSHNLGERAFARRRADLKRLSVLDGPLAVHPEDTGSAPTVTLGLEAHRLLARSPARRPPW